MWGRLLRRPCQTIVLEVELSQVEFLPCLMVFGLPSASHFGRFSWCGEFWAGLCSRDRVSDDDGSVTEVSPSRYSIFCNAVRTSKGFFTLVNPSGDKFSMVHLYQEDKPQKVAWGIQPQLSHAIKHVSMIAQGIKKAGKLSRMHVCDYTSLENSFKFLKPIEVFNKRKHYRVKLNSQLGLPH